jgi:type VI secretion system secreted protein VgrG
MTKKHTTNASPSQSIHAARSSDRTRWTQSHRSIAIGVGGMTADRLLLRSVEWREELGRPFEGRVKLRSEDHSIDPLEALGQGVVIRVDGPEGTTRRFTGFISRFEQTSAMRGGLAGYEATIVPWSWFMTRTADCRIFQGESAVEIATRVMKECPRSEVATKLMRRYAPYEYKVQYRETDFDFVQRVLEHEGIYYYFAHGDRSHVLTLLDSNGARLDGESDKALALRYLPGTRSKARPDAVFEWRQAAVVKPGRFHATDYDYRHPSTSLLSRAERARRHAAGDMEVFDYPGLYTEHPQGDQLVRVRMEELAADHLTIAGSTVNRFLHAGSRILLEDHPRADQNREHLVTAVTIVADGGAFDGDENDDRDDDTEVAVFDCGFEAIPKETQFRPARRTNVPQIRGPQTAVVVGPAGEEIHTDSLGRIRVHFHWDRHHDATDESSSCWMRVSQPWAGRNWGGMFLPRIGQEVIVEFLEADPDRPIITGRVYNAEQGVPYDLPANKTQSGFKTRSTKGGDGSNYNEIRFDDKHGEELFYLHAERDRQSVVENDNGESVGRNETLSVGSNRTKLVGVDETTSVGQNRLESVGISETVTVGSTRTHSIGVADALNVGSTQTISVGSTQTTQVGMIQSQSVGMVQSCSVGVAATATAGLLESRSAGLVQSISGGVLVTITAGVMLKLVGPGGTITIGNEGVHIKGGKVLIEGDRVDINP